MGLQIMPAEYQLWIKIKSFVTFKNINVILSSSWGHYQPTILFFLIPITLNIWNMSDFNTWRSLRNFVEQFMCKRWVKSRNKSLILSLKQKKTKAVRSLGQWGHLRNFLWRLILPSFLSIFCIHLCYSYCLPLSKINLIKFLKVN